MLHCPSMSKQLGPQSAILLDLFGLCNLSCRKAPKAVLRARTKDTLLEGFWSWAYCSARREGP